MTDRTKKPTRALLVFACLFLGALAPLLWVLGAFDERKQPSLGDASEARDPESTKDDRGANSLLETDTGPSVRIAIPPSNPDSPSNPNGTDIDLGSDKGLGLIDYWTAYYESPQGKLLAGASFARMSLESAEKDPAINPKRWELTEAERLALAFAMRPFDDAMTRAAIELHQSQWQAIRAKVLAKDYVVATQATGADTFEEVQKSATAEFERRTGIRTGLRVMVTAVPDVADGYSRIIALVRGEPHGHIETWDAVERTRDERTAAIKNWFANHTRDR